MYSAIEVLGTKTPAQEKGNKGMEEDESSSSSNSGD
jgi:hypothetical protein